MDESGWSATERAVGDHFPTGRTLDLSQAQDPVVRAEVLRHLLLGGGPSVGGQVPGLRLIGARVTGRLDLAYAEVIAPIRLDACRFEEPLMLQVARLKRVRLQRCELPGLAATNAEISGGLSLAGSVVTGRIDLVGARIDGAVMLDGAHLSDPGGTLNGSHLTVTGTIYAQTGFRSDGELRLGGATIAGALRWRGARLHNPGGRALDAPGLKVGGVVDFTDGFTATGTIRLSNAEIAGPLSLRGAELLEPCDVDLRSMVAGELALLPATAFPSRLDLGYAQVGLLRDDPGSWPAQVGLDGFVYQAIAGPAEVRDRLRWLERDPDGPRPQAYIQLAGTYQAAGRDDDARAVLYAREKRRRRGRVWSFLQNVTVGYGYKPVRAALWLVVLLAAGWGVFSVVRPRPGEAAKAPEFHALAYSADLLLPVIDLGQQSAYLPRGWTAWFAYFLVGAGLLFATTAVAAIARRLQRG